MSSYKAPGSGQNMPLSILGRSIVSTRGSYKNSPAGLTSSYDFHPLRVSGAWLCPFKSCHPWWDWMYSHKRLRPSQSGAGQDHQRGTGGMASRLWTHTSVQTSRLTTSKGPSRGPRHGYAGRCCPYVRWEPHAGSQCGELHQRTPPPNPPSPLLVLNTRCLKDNITPCQQAAGRLQVLGQEQSGAGISVFIRVRTRACSLRVFLMLAGSLNFKYFKNPFTQAFVILDVSIMNFSTKAPTTNIREQILLGTMPLHTFVY